MLYYLLHFYYQFHVLDVMFTAYLHTTLLRIIWVSIQ